MVNCNVGKITTCSLLINELVKNDVVKDKYMYFRIEQYHFESKMEYSIPFFRLFKVLSILRLRHSG